MKQLFAARLGLWYLGPKY